MSDYDRGAYTPPTDEPLAFDARTPQRRKPLPMTLIASGVILVVLLAAVLAFYRSGVRGKNEPPRVVGSPVAQIKTAPADEAKPLTEPQLDVYVADKAGTAAATGAGPSFAPPPEQPLARATAPTPPPVRPHVAAAEVGGEAMQVGAEPAPPPVSARAAPAPLRTAGASATAAALRPVKTASASLAGAQPKAGAAAPAAPASAAAASGDALVQIGAFNSRIIAEQELSKVRAGFARFVSGKGKHIETVDRDGHTLYRTAFSGFSRAQADAFCTALKSAGRSCLVK